MISFCTTAVNSKFEAKTFVETLNQHNQGVNFEICLVHDNRVDDGSAESFKDLQDEFGNLKVIENTWEDTLEWLNRLLDHYESLRIFPDEFRKTLKENLESLRNGTFLDPLNDLFWCSTGPLFNKAASIATGDILIFAPSDFIYSFNMQELEQYVISNRIDGIFYGKMNGLRDPISNEAPKLLNEAVNGPYIPDGNLTRRYINYPSSLKDIYLLDWNNKDIISLSDPTYPTKMIDICRSVEKDSARYAKMHHGTHVITRKTFEIVGGFTEEFYGRAWAEDKMNSLAMRVFWKDCSTLPIQFSFNWVSSSEWTPGLGKEDPEVYPPEFLTNNDPWVFKHPISGRNHFLKKYWHTGYKNKFFIENINTQLDDAFKRGKEKGRLTPPVRIIG
jgi:hypothetical protein